MNTQLIKKFEKIGGSEWAKGDRHRVYFNDVKLVMGRHYDESSKYRRKNFAWAMKQMYYNVKTSEFVNNGGNKADYNEVLEYINDRLEEI